MDGNVGEAPAKEIGQDRLEEAGKPRLCSRREDTGENLPGDDQAEEPAKERPGAWRDGDFRDHALKETSGAFEEIVIALVTNAKKGSIHHTRMLLALAGVNERSKKKAGSPARSEISLAKMLFGEWQRLCRPSAAEAGRAASEGSGPPQREAEDDEGPGS